MRFSFIHAADLHIDSPLAGLGLKDKAVAERFARAGRRAVEALVAETIASEAAFLIIAGDVFDGETEVATFPGDLPADLDALFNGGAFAGLTATSADKADFRFLKFRPPLLVREGNEEPALPHIRLDRALQFLIGDRLQ